MEQVIVDESRLKNVLKTALIEVLEERRTLFSELFTEALEEVALVHAIKEGEATKASSKAEIYKILEAKA
jgi:ribosomal protein L12E/L44/L45/RPP1/RPP2